MKSITSILFLVLLVACGEQSTQKAAKPQEAAPMQDNEELKTLHDNDQADRKAGEIDWSVVGERDSLRRARVTELIQEGAVKTANDHYHAAMVFQHGRDSVAYGMAVKMMRKAVDMDSAMNKWLLAAAIDRDLISRNKPQIYGTQYFRMNGEPWVLREIDTTKITDEERRAFGVRTRAEQRANLRKMNQKKLWELHSEGKTLEETIAFIKTEQDKRSAYDVSESGINSFGYQLMAEEEMDAALTIFKLNTELFPEGFNTWDSYGECLLELGQKEAAMAAYGRSLKLNPKNENARTVMQENTEA